MTDGGGVTGFCPTAVATLRELGKTVANDIMSGIIVIDRDGQRHALEAIEGWRVMEIIRDWGLPMEGTCGGACECGTCHVFVSTDWAGRLFPPREDEEAQLDMVPGAGPASRLSCQILWTEALDGLEVTLAPLPG